MSDWSEACDPVPQRRELTEAEKRQMQKRLDLRRRRPWVWSAAKDRPPAAWQVNPDFDEMGA